MIMCICCLFPPFLAIFPCKLFLKESFHLIGTAFKFLFVTFSANFLISRIVVLFGYDSFDSIANGFSYNSLFPVKYFGVLLVLSFLMYYGLYFLSKFIRFGFDIDRNYKIKKWKHIVTCILLFLGFLLLLLSLWVMRTYDNISFSEIVFHLKVPLSGTGGDFIQSAILEALLPAAGLALLLILIHILADKANPYVSFQNSKKKKTCHYLKIYQKGFVAITILIVSACTAYSVVHVGAVEYMASVLSNSTFIEDHYVDPTTVDISFPDEKRNLIYIFMESMETTCLSTELGGDQSDNLIPELTELAQEYINFSTSNLLGGACQVNGTGWTIAGMVAQTSGLPLKIPIEINSFDKYSTFLPGAYTLGEILLQENYNNYLLVGSDASFGGRKLYFEQHGDYDIFDYYSAVDEHYIGSHYFVWWGLEDAILYDIAKDSITELAGADEPFNFTMLTVDTHHAGGYICELCEDAHDSQYANSIACASKQVCNFVKWIQQQDFYENTTIIIHGDHLSMDPEFVGTIDLSYYRTVFDVIINSAVETGNTKNRGFTTMDMFPTTLSALGASISGDRLGLGTDLFSTTPTLVETYGLAMFEEELTYKSLFYDNVLLYP